MSVPARVGLTALAAFLLDLVTKALVRQWLPTGASTPLVPGLLYLTHVTNPGAVFGLLPNERRLFIAMTLLVLALVLLCAFLARDAGARVHVALGLQFGGAMGNLLDRLRFGQVTDFIDLRFWAVFNLADIAIIAGVGLFFWGLLREPQLAQRLAGRG